MLAEVDGQALAALLVEVQGREGTE
jgi:hypothetical protein